MKPKTKIEITSTIFPDQFVSDAEKETPEFGLRVGEAVQYEWFSRDGGICQYYNRWQDFHKFRRYARGEQSVDKYKTVLAVEGDLSYMNLDWAIFPVLPKFIDVIVNGMSERMFKIRAYAHDSLSQERRNSYQDMIEGQMAAKDVLSVIQEATGANPFMMDPDELPINDEEVALHMQLRYKPSIEIAEEVAISSIWDDSGKEELRKRWNYDMTVLGVAFGAHQFLEGVGVNVEYIDPATVVHSYTEDPYFRDCFYWGYVKIIPIADIVHIDPTLKTEDLKEIAQIGGLWYNHHALSSYYDRSVFNDSCALLYFYYKTTKRIVYKKKILENGGSRMIEKDEGFNPPEEETQKGRFKKIEKTIDVWYEGIMVLGTKRILKWTLMRNMVRPKAARQHALSPIIGVAPRMYKGVIESLCRRMIPFADLIQLTHIKIQQVQNRMVPDGVFIDADGINNVDLGNGQAYNPKEALNLYFQTGSVIGRSYTQEGDYNNARVPITPLAAHAPTNKLQMLISTYNHYLDMLRGVTGIPAPVDASSPDPRALVGVQKLAALNSNVATRHVLEGCLYIFREMSLALSYRISDILDHPEFREEFANKVGRYNASVLEDIKDLHLHDFGIYIDISPDDEERSQLDANIHIALSKENIDIEDAIDIREIGNIKQANQLLKIKRRRKLQRDEQMKMQLESVRIQGEMEKNKMASEARANEIQMEMQGKMQLAELTGMLAIKKMQVEAQLKEGLMDKEFNYNIQLAEITEQNLSKREGSREDAKAKRISQQNSEQSRLLYQRQSQTLPQRFESNEDSLDGFALEEFSPR